MSKIKKTNLRGGRVVKRPTKSVKRARKLKKYIQVPSNTQYKVFQPSLMYKHATRLGCPPNYAYTPDPNQTFPIDINKVVCAPQQYTMGADEPILTSIVKTINGMNPQQYLDNVETKSNGR